MEKGSNPKQLVIDLIDRSICSVRVAAVTTDVFGRIIGWGWNHSGPTGMGLHAEKHAISRSNKERLYLGTIYVAGTYDRGTLVNSKPCRSCQKLIDKYGLEVIYRAKAGDWRRA